MFFLLAGAASGAERWILIAGTVGQFRTDVRLFNPSFDRDIEVEAHFLTADAMQFPARVIVPKRQMMILDDAVATLFDTDKLGAIRFFSEDEFEVTSRIYAATPAGTLGQFAPGLSRSGAKRAGALLHLRSSGSGFRTNLGAVNPNSAWITVSWTLHDRSNAAIASRTIQIPPLGVIPPANMAGGFFPDLGGADISDAWVSYHCEYPLFVYASVIDGGTADQTFIPAVDDKGAGALPTTTHEFAVTLENFSITLSPAPAAIRQGDTIVLHIRVKEGTHSFELWSPTGTRIILPTAPGSSADKSFVAEREGIYLYACANPDCGEGHVNMTGSIRVRNSDVIGTH